MEFDPQGRIVRTSSAEVPGDPNIRPYSLTVVEKIDRVVTGSADMMGAKVSHVAQIWRLSDLKLIKTLQLPTEPDWFYDTAADSSEPRVLADGKTVLVPTFNCGLFLVRNLASDTPTLQHVYDFGYRTCEVPLVAGDFWWKPCRAGTPSQVWTYTIRSIHTKSAAFFYRRMNIRIGWRSSRMEIV